MSLYRIALQTITSWCAAGRLIWDLHQRPRWSSDYPGLSPPPWIISGPQAQVRRGGQPRVSSFRTETTSKPTVRGALRPIRLQKQGHSFSLLTCFFAICLSNQQQTHDMTCICSVTLPLMMSQVVELMPATLTEIEFCFRDWSSRRLLLHQVCVPNSFPFTSCVCLESEPFPFSLRLQRRMGGASSKPLRHSVASQTHNQDRKSQC